MKTILRVSLPLLLAMAIVGFSACSGSVKEQGTVRISLGAGAGARSTDFTGWDNKAWPLSADYIQTLTYTVIVNNGPGAEVKRENVAHGQTVSFTLTPGRWDFTVEAYDGSSLKAAGVQKSFEVKSGPNGAVAITMQPIRATGVSIQPNKIELVAGDDKLGTAAITAKVEPAAATFKNALTWEIADRTVAQIDFTGGDCTVTALAGGDTKITVRTVDGAFTAECIVSVKAAEETETAEKFVITFAQIADPAEEIIASNITLSLAGVSVTVIKLEAPEQYGRITWYVNDELYKEHELPEIKIPGFDLPDIKIPDDYGIINLDAGDYEPGTHFLTVEVEKDGVPYNKTVSFRVEGQ